MTHWIAGLLGWVSSLGGVPLHYGECHLPWWNGDRFAYECEFDASTCDATGCGAELSAFETTIEAYNDRVFTHGTRDPRWHRPGYTIRLRGRIPLRWDEPYVSTGDHISVDCTHAIFITRSSDVPLVHSRSQALEHGMTALPSPPGIELRDGDILIPDSDPGHSMPVVANLPRGKPGTFGLGWPWDGRRSDAWSLSVGALIVIEGSWTEHGTCEVLCAGDCRWHPDGTGRQIPASAVRANGYNNTTHFVTTWFDHPGDFQQVNGRSPRSDGRPRGVGYGRFLGIGTNDPRAIPEHIRRRARGAIFLNLGGVMEVAPQLTLAGAYRYALFAGNTHDLRMDVRDEGVVQALWAPAGCQDCRITDTMTEHADHSVDLPWILIGRRTDHLMSGLVITVPLAFARWTAPYRPFFRSEGPVALSILGGGRNWLGLDLAPGSTLIGGFIDTVNPRRSSWPGARGSLHESPGSTP